MSEDIRHGDTYITNNYNGPIGQNIANANTVNINVAAPVNNGTVGGAVVEPQAAVEPAAAVETQAALATCCNDSLAQRLRRAVGELYLDGVLQYLYDYTWVMEAMNATPDMPHFASPSEFLRFLGEAGVKSLPSADSIQQKQNTFTGKFPNWQFTDCDAKPAEATRRINVGRRAITAMKQQH